LQVEAIEQHRANLSRSRDRYSHRSPFDAARPYRNTSLEDADIDPDVGWQGLEVNRSRILGRRNRSNALRFGANEGSGADDNDNDERSTEFEVTAETQWALEQAGLIRAQSEYHDNDDDDGR
jgi:hypothetical protein